MSCWQRRRQIMKTCIAALIILCMVVAVGHGRADDLSAKESLGARADVAVEAYVAQKPGSYRPLMALHSYGDGVLRLLPKYLADPRLRAENGAYFVLCSFQTDAAIPAFVGALRNPKGIAGPSSELFYNYTEGIIRNMGGTSLRNTLIWGILHGDSQVNHAMWPLLLASFQGDRMAIEFLKGLQRMEVDAPQKIVSMPPILAEGATQPQLALPDLGEQCCLTSITGRFSVPYEFALHLALAELHEKCDEEAVLWRLRDSDLPSIMFTVACAGHISNKRLLLALVELIHNQTPTGLIKPWTLSGTPIYSFDYMRVCDYTVAMLTTALQVDSGIPSLTAEVVKQRGPGYRPTDYNSIGHVRQYSHDELEIAYSRLKAAVENMPGK